MMQYMDDPEVGPVLKLMAKMMGGGGMPGMGGMPAWAAPEMRAWRDGGWAAACPTRTRLRWPSVGS